jgi:putative protease
MELLSPAGNLEKLKYAYLFGADAAYIGIKDFSLRAKADNFHDEEHVEAGRIKGDRKLYGALNIYFHEGDLSRLEAELDYISLYPFDAFIVSDPGAARLLMRRFPGVPLHLSTQANCVNSETAKMYRDLGFARITLGRELSLAEIEAIKKAAEIEVEVFAHGAMCLAYSGRCFLSRYMADRSANKGDCAHSCRWGYRVLEEEQRTGEFFPVVQGEGFTSILSSKDLCMIDHLPELISAGVDSIKIEGRMKSIYYTALVTRAYRKMLDSVEGRGIDDPIPFREELLKISHREYSTGFYFDRDEIEKPSEKPYVREYSFLATIGSSEGDGIHKLDVKNQIRITDTLEYVGYDVLFIRDKGFSLLDEDMNPIEKVDHGKTCFLKTDKPVKEGYIIRRKLT